jgi:hypothetical protein
MASMASLSGPVPSALTDLTNALVLWRLHGSPNLCILDAASQTTADKCTAASNPCPYPACACKWASQTTTCPSGTDGPAVALNPLSPYYPTAAYCCANGTGNTIRERMVALSHLDCSTRPCTVGAAGVAETVVTYNNDASITGTIPPQIATMPAVAQVQIFNNVSVTGTLPTQLGLLTLVRSLQLQGNNGLTGTMPTQLGSMTALKRLYAYVICVCQCVCVCVCLRIFCSVLFVFAEMRRVRSLCVCCERGTHTTPLFRITLHNIT